MSRAILGDDLRAEPILVGDSTSNTSWVYVLLSRLGSPAAREPRRVGMSASEWRRDSLMLGTSSQPSELCH